MANRLFPQEVEDIEIDRALMAELRSQWTAWRPADQHPEDGYGTTEEPWEIRTVGDAIVVIGREDDLQVPSTKEAERYRAFIKKLDGYQRVQCLWEEEQSAQLRRYEWATLRDLALLAVELDRRASEMARELKPSSEAREEGDLDEFDNPATVAGTLNAADAEPGADQMTESVGAALAPPLRCVEIGGGFGRLNDGMLHLFKGRAKMVVVEADPVALAASHAYLSARWPDLNTKICTAPMEASNFDGAEILIVPWWHIGGDALAGRADVLAYLSLIEALSAEELAEHFAVADRIAAPEGLLYFMQSHDRLNSRDYSHPATWQVRYKRRTPWSETPDHPAEIYLKTDRDCRALNRRAELAYLRTVVRQYRIERYATDRLVGLRSTSLEQFANEREFSRAKLAALTAALSGQQERNARLIAENDGLNERLERMRLEAEGTERSSQTPGFGPV